MKKLIILSLFVTLLLILLVGCESTVPDLEISSRSSYVPEKEEVLVTQDMCPMHLGEPKRNPFSVSNMRRALEYLKNQDDKFLESAGVIREELCEIKIYPTDIYVKMAPYDSLAYQMLLYDKSLILFDYPLDCEIKQSGDYIESDRDDDIKWYYTTIKPGYRPIDKVRCANLEYLFIPENSMFYPEGEAFSEETASPIMDDNMATALMIVSFALTDNIDELLANPSNVSSPITTRSTYTDVRYYSCFGITWSKSKTYYCPDGKISVETPMGNVGLKGAKVRVSRWFYSAEARTDENGYYYCKRKWNSILIGNAMNYSVYFNGVNKSNEWTLDRTIFYAGCLWTNRYYAGLHTPDGISLTFMSGNNNWARAVLHNAVYDYIDFASVSGLSLPPRHLQIANYNPDISSYTSSSSAPLLANHFNWSLVYNNPAWGTLATFFGYMYLGFIMPDLILSFSSDINDYNATISTTWHELIHSSQLTRMNIERNFFWASDYWSRNVLQQATNSMNKGNPYGNPYAANWEIIALSEGWGLFMEWKLGKENLLMPVDDVLVWQHNKGSVEIESSLLSDMAVYSDVTRKWIAKDYTGYDFFALDVDTFKIPCFVFRKSFKHYSEINYKYAEMFNRLYNIGCTINNLEKALSSTDKISTFYEIISHLQPQFAYDIDIIMQEYLPE